MDNGEIDQLKNKKIRVVFQILNILILSYSKFVKPSAHSPSLLITDYVFH